MSKAGSSQAALKPTANRFQDVSGLLDIRPAVTWRDHALKDSVALYLSLYDDEIDFRAARFWEVLKTHSPEKAVVHLELTDAVLCFGPTGDIWLARGGAATFPLYWRSDGHKVFFATRLPVDSGAVFSKSGLVSAAAATCLHSSYEPNGFVETPLNEWCRVRRAAFMRFRDGAPAKEQVIVAPDTAAPESRASIAERIRTAFEGYREMQACVRKSLLEVSGGFDSTLAAAAAPRHEMRGVSVAFPFYEFRFESGVQQAVAEALAIPRGKSTAPSFFPIRPAKHRPASTNPRFLSPAFGIPRRLPGTPACWTRTAFTWAMAATSALPPT
jgi:hypothetical protein